MELAQPCHDIGQHCVGRQLCGKLAARTGYADLHYRFAVEPELAKIQMAAQSTVEIEYNKGIVIAVCSKPVGHICLLPLIHTGTGIHPDRVAAK